MREPRGFESLISDHFKTQSATQIGYANPRVEGSTPSCLQNESVNGSPTGRGIGLRKSRLAFSHNGFSIMHSQDRKIVVASLNFATAGRDNVRYAGLLWISHRVSPWKGPFMRFETLNGTNRLLKVNHCSVCDSKILNVPVAHQDRARVS